MASRAVADQASGRLANTKPKKWFLDEEMPEHAVVACLPTNDADAELAHRAVPHGDPIVTVVDHPYVTELRLRVAARQPGRRRRRSGGRSDRG